MWVAWGLLPALQVLTNRYLLYYWQYRLTAHVVLGTLNLVLSGIAFTIILKVTGFVIFEDFLHNASGTIAVMLGFLLSGTGTVAFVLLKWVNMDYDTHRLLSIKRFHKYFGYFITIAVQFVLVSGLLRILNQPLGRNNQSLKSVLIFIDIFCFLVPLMAMEFYHQRKLKENVPLKAQSERKMDR